MSFPLSRQGRGHQDRHQERQERQAAGVADASTIAVTSLRACCNEPRKPAELPRRAWWDVVAAKIRVPAALALLALLVAVLVAAALTR